jgi:hypothetical protein
MLDEFDELEKESQMFEFIEVPSYIALVSFNTNEPIYIVKVDEKGKATDKMEDRDGHVIPPDYLF